MALKTDYVDAVFSGNRKYQMVANSDGTYSFIDVTDYEVDGSYFGAEDINETNNTINNLDLGLTDGSVTRVGKSTIGSTSQPIYLNLGVPTAISSTVGGAARPVYLNSGTITACSNSVGSGTVPVYMNSGTITASTSTVGSGSRPVYLNGGTITACGSTVGSATGPVYLNSGTITACNSMLPLSGGTMTGLMYAYNNTNYDTYQVRNAAFLTSKPSSMTNGTICFVYST